MTRRRLFLGCLGIIALFVLCIGSMFTWLLISTRDYRNVTLESESHTLVHDSIVREYRLYVPESVAESAPLLLVLHGGGGDTSSMERLTGGGFNRLADAEGFIVAYPGGYENHWNDGRQGVDAWSTITQNIDDVGFLDALIDHLSTAYPIDADRVYATGFSNGGMMSFRLACENPGRYAAFAPVGSLPAVSFAETCQPAQPAPMLIIIGDADPLVPWDGGTVRLFRQQLGEVLSAEMTFALWRDRLGCDSPSQTSTLGTATTIYRYTSCADGVELVIYVIDGAGHVWPGGNSFLPAFFIGAPSEDFNAHEVIWSFFGE